VEKYKLSGIGLATLEPGTLGLATMDALHFKTMALDRNFERVRATALHFVGGAVSLQVSLQLPMDFALTGNRTPSSNSWSRRFAPGLSSTFLSRDRVPKGRPHTPTGRRRKIQSRANPKLDVGCGLLGRGSCGRSKSPVLNQTNP